MEANNMAAMREALGAINCINTIGLKRLLVELVEADIFDGGLINKTISAIEKAKRALAAPARNCDRFDDLKKEKSTEASNLQELKDAAIELMKFTCNSCERRFCEEDVEEEDGQSVPSPCSAIIRMRNALSANPIRNCDLPLVVDGPANNNADKAWLVFRRHNPDAYFDVPGLLRCIDWLFAPATEQKGGDKK